MIGIVREQRLEGVLVDAPLRRRIGALHLVEDDAAKAERPVGLVQLKVPAFLLEVLRGQKRVEDSV